MTAPLLSATDLTVELPRGGRWFPAVDHVSFELRRGETLALAGESGCGKSLLARALIRLTPDSARVSGAVAWEGRPLLGLPEKEWGRIRGGLIGMVFQESGAALDPVRTVGDQVAEAIRLHGKVSAAEARRRAVDRLREAAFPDPETALDEYPHRLSGGQKQRVGIAIALAADPALLIADEPTTALDATVAAEVLDLLARLKRSRGLTMLLISHDLGIVARESDRVLVLYAGRIVEEGATGEVFRAPRHPYTRGLLASQPRLGGSAGPRRFAGIGGAVPDLFERAGTGCAFAPRCPDRFEPCDRSRPPLFVDGPVAVRCFLYESSGSRPDGDRRAS
jgi:oligopeptide/dipeptide ABC transporter ATP-binding protein